MAFKVNLPKNLLMFRKFNFPEMDVSPIEMNYDPPRNIDLSEEDENLVQQSINALADSGLTKETLFDLFTDWQSSKTRSIKRFVVSITFILTLAWIAGIELANIEMFGLAVHEGREAVFTFALFFIVVVTSLFLVVLRRIDWKIHKAKVDIVPIEKYSDLVDRIDEIVKKYQLRDAKMLFRDFRSKNDYHREEAETYEAIQFYRKKLQSPRRGNSATEIAEIIAIFSLFLGSMFSILASL